MGGQRGHSNLRHWRGERSLGYRVDGGGVRVLSSAAIWQSFRARLPYLFDRVEPPPPAPTLVHAMVGIVLMVEGIAIIGGIAVAAGGAGAIWATRTIAYGIVGFLAWIVMSNFLSGRGVKLADIWLWTGAGARVPMAVTMILAAAGGCVWGLALLYQTGLHELPFTRDYMVRLSELTLGLSEHKVWMFVLAVGMAPLAEEFFFRGLLYRALDREWGGVRAMVGSAAYFAIYHPPVSWIPVFCVGFASAWLFKRGGNLMSCVLLHMAYNAVVVGFG